MVEEDEYRGWHIPKGTTVIANLRYVSALTNAQTPFLTAKYFSAMLHDESVYSKPHEFIPDRYSPTPENPSGEPDPSRAAFGFGRR